MRVVSAEEYASERERWLKLAPPNELPRCLCVHTLGTHASGGSVCRLCPCRKFTRNTERP